MSKAVTCAIDLLLKERDAATKDAHQQRCVVDACQQVAGKALGYPWFNKDPELLKLFPDSTERNGVFIGEHVEETIVEELARAYRETRNALANREIECGRLKAERDALRDSAADDAMMTAENAEMLLRWREAATQACLALEPILLSGQHRTLLLGVISESLPIAVDMLRRVIARDCEPEREAGVIGAPVTYPDLSDVRAMDG